MDATQTLPASRSRGMPALIAACLTALMFGLEISSVPAILPTLEKALPANFKEMQWIMNAYTIAVTGVLMAAGTLADRYGRKRVFLIAIMAFAIASLACGLAPNATVLIVARIFQGLSGGAALICSVAILSQQFREPAERAMAFSVWGVVFGIGLGFGPIIGSAIVALSGWQWVFLVHTPGAVGTALLALASIRESRDPDAERLDIGGIATLSLSVSCLAYFITQGPDLGFTSPQALTILAVAAASFVAFLLIERTVSRPMIDVSVFRIRAFSGAIIGAAAMNVSYWPFMIYLPIWFEAGLGYDGLTAGLVLLAYTLPTLAVPPLAEQLARRYRAGIVIPAGLFTIGLGFMAMKLGTSVATPSWLTMLPGCLLSGIGIGLANTPVTNTSTASVPAERAGMASGIDLSARMISLAINIALMGFILVEGVRASLAAKLAAGTDATALRNLAEKVAAGAPIGPETGLSAALTRQALADGFGAVMLYGGIGVWLLAAVSLMVFARASTPNGAISCQAQ
jgi:EmrB/QacA subfamily drug resistance transporter